MSYTVIIASLLEYTHLTSWEIHSVKVEVYIEQVRILELNLQSWVNYISFITFGNSIPAYIHWLQLLINTLTSCQYGKFYLVNWCDIWAVSLSNNYNIRSKKTYQHTWKFKKRILTKLLKRNIDRVLELDYFLFIVPLNIRNGEIKKVYVVWFLNK